MRSTLAFQTTLWLILLAARLASCESSSQQCPASRPYALSFSVVSRRNMTGHWKSELKMQNNGGSDVSGNKEDGPWEVDLVQTSEMTKSGEIFTVNAILEGPPAKPGPGYELVPDLGYYKLHTSLVTWEEARNTCSKEGAHLAIPRSQKEVNVLLGLLSRHPKIQDGELNKYAFTGIHDQYSEGQFVDIFGNPADMTALKWFPGQPNDGGKALQNCIGLMREGKINDIYCHNKLPFLCEQKIQVY